MAIRSAMLGLFMMSAGTSMAQVQHEHWLMGFGAGLHFNGGVPMATGGPLSTDEGCASIADNNGQLLFFTNGEQVWDSNWNVMPNGSGLLGHFSSTQSALIIPVPGAADQYEIFTTPAGAGFWAPTDIGHHYRVDMTANGGLGDVVTNAELASPLTEKLTATRHTNGNDVWVVYHGWNNANYYAYLVTCTGVEGPVVSTIGHEPGLDAVGNPEGYAGCMKLNRQGTLLGNVWTRSTFASQSDYQSDVIIDLLDFDKSTGVLSNLRSDTLGTGSDLQSGYGLEFSPNGELLYVSDHGLFSGGFNARLWQYDLDLPFNDPFQVTTGFRAFGTMQIGPDGAIYIARLNGANYLSKISAPNMIGVGCGFEDVGVSLGDDMSTWGLPNHWDTYPEPIVFDPIPLSDTLVCEVVDLTLNATYSHPFHVPNYLWSTGETTASISVTDAGTYSVEIMLPCSSLYDTVHVGRGGLAFDLGEDLRICDDRTVSISAPNAESILWSTGDTIPTITAAEQGIYSVQLTDTIGCTTVDSIHVSTRNCACAMHMPNAFSPNNDGINDVLRPVMDCEPEAFELELFDRWGVPLFRSTDALIEWEATSVPIGVYAYRLNYSWDDGEALQRRERSGHVTLVR